MAQPSVHGRFIWQELMTADAAAAGTFYSRIIGWRTQPFPNADSSYSMFLTGSGPVGGFSRLSPDSRDGRAKPHWLPYVGTDDVDATVAAAERLGGKMLHPGTDTEKLGRYAVLADPQGAVFGIYKPQQAAGPAKNQPQPGEFAWQELASSDHEAAFKFYSELFGWQILRRVQMGSSGTYLVFGRDGVQRGGIYQQPDKAPVPHWLSYIEVASVDALLAQVREGGGEVVTGPTDVPGGSRVAQLRDSAGALFAVHTTAKAAADTTKAPSKPPAHAKTGSASTSSRAAPSAASQSSTRPSAAAKPAATERSASKPTAAPTAAAVAAKKAAGKKAAGKKAVGRKAAGNKAAAKKTPTAARKKTAARKSAAKSAKKSLRSTGARRVRPSAGRGKAARGRNQSPRRKTASAGGASRKSAAKTARAKSAAKSATRKVKRTRVTAGRTARKK